MTALRLLFLWTIGLPFALIYTLADFAWDWLRFGALVWPAIRAGWRSVVHTHREIVDPGCHQREAIERMMPNRGTEP